MKLNLRLMLQELKTHSTLIILLILAINLQNREQDFHQLGI
jgi:hypothetical protein